jgi:superfamily II DNA or RNA helicase
MKLRKWQTECLRQVLNKYASNHRHFLCLATPGAGKTTMAAEVVANLFELGLIDFVLCFSPSVIISNDIRQTLEKRTNKRFDGLIGAKGDSFTYQSMQYLNDEIWQLLKSHRVLCVFDELHHCSGSSPDNANAWGEDIITKIQDQAAYTLALTGTPWRSDNTPIALAEYQGSENRILCDYVYGLAEAIQDQVCRTPQIIVTDNNNISIQESGETIESFSSFSELLNETPCPYQTVVENETVIRHIICQANNKLTEIRKVNPYAGGLVVTSSVDHALKILNILHNEFNESAVIATYRENEPTTIIKDFKHNSTPWIVSVGMISEGTNIPRLQVCCHLTRIKTELHFRQILGRILRMTDSPNQEACLFMPAEKTLINYAYRVAEDIPDENAVVRFENSDTGICIDVFSDVLDADTDPTDKDDTDHQIAIGSSKKTQCIETSTHQNQPSLLTQTYEATLNVFGRFQQDILALDISPFD